MGTKLKKQQLKKEWTESGTQFPEEYVQKVRISVECGAEGVAELLQNGLDTAWFNLFRSKTTLRIHKKTQMLRTLAQSLRGYLLSGQHLQSKER